MSNRHTITDEQCLEILKNHGIAVLEGNTKVHLILVMKEVFMLGVNVDIMKSYYKDEKK